MSLLKMYPIEKLPYFTSEVAKLMIFFQYKEVHLKKTHQTLVISQLLLTFASLFYIHVLQTSYLKRKDGREK